MSEADLCIRLEEYFRDYEIYKEVPTNGGRCDMYIKKGFLWVAVEVKKQFSMKLVYQALRNKPHANYSYVAVPDLKGSYEATEICKLLGIGVLEYRIHYAGCEEWQEMVKPPLRRRITPLKVLDRFKNAIAGTQHSTESEFKVTLEYMKLALKRAGGRMPIKKTFENEKYHYSSSRSAMQCITKLCKKGAIKDFYIDGDSFVLTANCSTTIQPQK